VAATAGPVRSRPTSCTLSSPSEAWGITIPIDGFNGPVKDVLDATMVSSER